MTRIILSIILVLLVIFVVPFIVYGLLSKLIGAEMPKGVSPSMFLLSVLISKIGTAIAFVLIFYFARNSLSKHWFLYAFVWWLMFVIDESSRTIGLNYSWKEAIAGIISETVYFPISAYIVYWLIK